MTFFADATDKAVEHLQAALAAERRDTDERLAELQHVADLQDTNRKLVRKLAQARARIRELEGGG